MPNPSWVDALAGLFENPLFQFGANLSALSGKHRFGEAFGGAVAATGKNITAAKRQKALEELQAEELGIRKETLGLNKQQLEARLAKEKEQALVGSQTEAALAGIPGIDPLTRLKWHYMISRGLNPFAGGGYQDQMLGMSRERLGLAQDAAARAQAEIDRKAVERGVGEKLIEDQLADVDADPTLSPQEKTDKKFAIRAKRSPPKRLSATEQSVRDAIEAKKRLDAGGGNGSATPKGAPAPAEPGWIGSGMNWLSGKAHELLTPGAHPLGVGGNAWTGGGVPPGLPIAGAGAPATPLAPPPPGVPMTGAVSPVTPLAPPVAAQDPAALLSGLEAQLKVLNPVERGVAKMKLQQMLANPALAGLHERIKGLFGQL